MTATYLLTVFYDGACGVCSKEMRHYRKVADQRVRFVDIAAADFSADIYGRSNDDFQRELHVCDADGNFFTGVEAFRKLWDALPSPFYPLLSSPSDFPGSTLRHVQAIPYLHATGTCCRQTKTMYALFRRRIDCRCHIPGIYRFRVFSTVFLV